MYLTDKTILSPSKTGVTHFYYIFTNQKNIQQVPDRSQYTPLSSYPLLFSYIIISVYLFLRRPVQHDAIIHVLLFQQNENLHFHLLLLAIA